MKRWKLLAIAIASLVAAVFLVDIIAHPTVYFGYDPFPGIFKGIATFLRIAFFAISALAVLWLVGSILSSTNSHREEGEAHESRGETFSVGDVTFKVTLPESGWSEDYPLEVVGESHYQKALNNICGGKDDEGHREEVVASLVLEDNNRYDKKAVRVDIEGETVGYLSKENARKFRRKFSFKGKVFECDAIIIGGWDRGGGDTGHYGVRLDLEI